jgi:hypothetical protein
VLPQARVRDLKTMSENVIERLDHAHELIRAGRIAEAVELLRQLAARHPDNLEAWFTLGQAQGMLDHDAEAEAAFGKAVELRPEMHEAHFNLALSRLYQKKLRASIPAFLAARSLKHDTPGLEKTLLEVFDAVLQDEPAAPFELVAIPPLDAQPRVSVIMPTQNRLGLLADALASVGRQSYPNWEAIVVNDGGEDVSGVIAALPHDLAAKIAVLPLAVAEGQANARNLGIDAARGEVIAFLDDDDLFLPLHLETLVAGLRRSGAGVAYTVSAKIEEKLVDGKRIECAREILPELRYSRALLLVRNYIPIDNWGVRRECLAACGGFDDTLACLEDWELLMRLSERNAFHRIESVTVEIRTRQNASDSVTSRRPAGPVCEQIYRCHPSGGSALIDAARDVYINAQFPLSRPRAPYRP